MKGRTAAERVLFHISRFCSFYLVIALVTSVTIVLFCAGMELDEALVRRNAPQTLLCTLILAGAGCAVDALRRHLTLERPVDRIVGALERIGRGELDHRLDIRDFSEVGFREICEGLNRLARELGSVETLRTDFISNVSHELKTPLSVIRNYAVLLRDETLPPEQRRQYTQAIADTAGQMAELVSNILRLNKLENQQIFPQTCSFDLGEQLAGCLLQFESAWEEKSLELECELAEDIRVEADPELLSLLWNNLLSNAVKFTPNGGKLSVKLTAEEDWALVTIADTGCGMSAETGRHIFEKFYQGDTAHATRGNGLGLALVKRVVDITGGVITVSSTLGKGSTFTVRLERGSHGTD